jgi:hypothetical protein
MHSNTSSVDSTLKEDLKGKIVANTLILIILAYFE